MGLVRPLSVADDNRDNFLAPRPAVTAAITMLNAITSRREMDFELSSSLGKLQDLGHKALS